MGGGLLGVGFAVVDMRDAQAAKRFLGDADARRDFLLEPDAQPAGVHADRHRRCCSAFAYLVFDIRVRGNVLALVVADRGRRRVASRGMGLLIGAAREDDRNGLGADEPGDAADVRAVGGVLLVRALPGRGAAVIQALPLTALNDGLRAIMNDGARARGAAYPLLVLGIWGVACFALALRIFRWR